MKTRILIFLLILQSCVVNYVQSPEMDKDIIQKTVYVRIVDKVEDNGYFFKVKRYNHNKTLLYSTPNTQYIEVSKSIYLKFEPKNKFVPVSELNNDAKQ